jgi:hypothetical protein
MQGKKRNGTRTRPVSEFRSGFRIQRGLDGFPVFFDLRLALCSSPFRFIEQGIRPCNQDTVFERIRIVSPGNDIRSIFFEIIFTGKLHNFCSLQLFPGWLEHRRERPVLVLAVDPPGFFQIGHLQFFVGRGGG